MVAQAILPPAINRDLTGRTVIVTGSNVGLGYEAAKHFYSMHPARLILAVRDLSKGEEARKTIVETDLQAEATVEVWNLDLASFENTKAFAKRVESELERLDVLLMNAAVATQEYKPTKDGWEVSLQVNVLSNFMLAALLTPLLKKTATLPPVASPPLKPHLVVVASGIHFQAKFPERSASHIFNALNDKAQFLGADRYTVTKLLDVLLTRQLSKTAELAGGDVVVCNVCPGFCRSELMREYEWDTRQSMYESFPARTTEEGSRTYLWASLTDDIPLGAYSSSCTLSDPSPFVQSPDGNKAQQKLWEEMVEILVQQAPETKEIWKVAA